MLQLSSGPGSSENYLLWDCWHNKTEFPNSPNAAWFLTNLTFFFFFFCIFSATILGSSVGIPHNHHQGWGDWVVYSFLSFCHWPRAASGGINFQSWQPGMQLGWAEHDRCLQWVAGPCRNGECWGGTRRTHVYHTGHDMLVSCHITCDKPCLISWIMICLNSLHKCKS